MSAVEGEERWEEREDECKRDLVVNVVSVYSLGCKCATSFGMGNASYEVQQERDHQHFKNLFSLGASDSHGLSWRREKAKRLAVKCGSEAFKS